MGKYTGQKYCPSNGTDGMIFIEKFCEQCIHEKFIHTGKEPDKKCDIFSNTMVYDINDKEYPSEWQYDENDNPTCTSFKKWDWGTDDGDDGLNDPPEPDDPNQLVMPFILEEIEIKISKLVLEPSKL
jgi:hypothetical protein